MGSDDEGSGSGVGGEPSAVRRGVVESAVTALSTVGFGLASGAFLPGAGELVGSSIGAEVARLATALHEHRRLRAERTFDMAADGANLAPEDLADRLVGTAAQAQLAVIVLDGASRSIAEAKLRMFADILGSGALCDDDAQIAIDTLLALALADLEAPHFRVLAELGFDPSSTEGLRSTLDPLAEGLDALLAVLRSHGLVDRERRRPTAREIAAGEQAQGGPDEWCITSFGEELLERARSVGMG